MNAMFGDIGWDNSSAFTVTRVLDAFILLLDLFWRTLELLECLYAYVLAAYGHVATCTGMSSLTSFTGGLVYH